MKFKHLFLSALLAGGCYASADFQSISQDLVDIADVASNVFYVKHVKAGKYAYKVVSMDTRLNGDLSDTVMVLVGENGVGGAAGYEAAFHLPVTEARNSLVGVRRVKNKVELTFSDLSGKKSKLLVRYDRESKTLIEDN